MEFVPKLTLMGSKIAKYAFFGVFAHFADFTKNKANPENTIFFQLLELKPIFFQVPRPSERSSTQ